ncbi:MAG: hypothetical protein ACOZAO_00765 [Patescibacteria group bacterium]
MDMYYPEADSLSTFLANAWNACPAYGARMDDLNAKGLSRVCPLAREVYQLVLPPEKFANIPVSFMCGSYRCTCPIEAGVLEQALTQQEELPKLKKLGNELMELQAKLNEGRGHSVSQTIAWYLQQGDKVKAKATAFNESDKFTFFEVLQQWLINNLFVGEEHPWEFTV